jgi:hypothetical protein
MADEQTFWAIMQWRCLSAKPALQSLCGLSSIIICVRPLVFIFFARNFFKHHITPHTLHFPSVEGHKTEPESVFYVF